MLNKAIRFLYPCLVFGCFPFSSLCAQTKTIDSLRTVILLTKQDTNRVKALCALGEEFINKPDSALAIWNSALTISEKNLKGANGKVKQAYLCSRAEALNDIGYVYNHLGNSSKALDYYLKSLKIREETKDKKGTAVATNNIGAIYMKSGNTAKALEYFQQGEQFFEEMKDPKNAAYCLTNIGSIYEVLGNISPALEYYHRSLKISEQLGDKIGTANCLNNIGQLYENQGQLTEALENLTKCLALMQEVNSRSGIGNASSNIGYVYQLQGNLPKALDYFNSALKTWETLKDKNHIAITRNNIASVLTEQGKYTEAMVYFKSNLITFQEARDKNDVALSLGNIGKVYFKEDSLTQAEEYCTKALNLARELGYPATLKSVSILLKDIYTRLNKPAQALEMYMLYVQMRDSVSNSETRKASLKKQMQYEYEKKEVVLKAEKEKQEILYKGEILQNQMKFEYDEKQQRLVSEKEKEVLWHSENLKRLKLTEDFNRKKAAAQMESEKNELMHAAQNKQQQTIIYFAIAILCLVLTGAVFLFNRFRVTRKQKQIIELQKETVEHKNREITQSIEYALRIQTAILPPSRIVRQHLPDSFILYKPKDIVAGDFYWMETSEDLILFAACDCTGHGVPGAMVSVICHNALNRVVREFGLTRPAAILDKTAEIVIENFSKSEDSIKDGMDISLCAFRPSAKTLEWAGANNPLWLLQNGELLETKADKQPIGKFEYTKPFINHTFELKKGDSIYIFTDGFADQFGGAEKQKKLTRKRFKELLLDLQQTGMPDQGKALDKFIMDYKRELEQVDDILVMGARI